MQAINIFSLRRFRSYIFFRVVLYYSMRSIYGFQYQRLGYINRIVSFCTITETEAINLELQKFNNGASKVPEVMEIDCSIQGIDIKGNEFS